MKATSTVMKKNVVPGSWRGSRTGHTLLFEMAREAAELAAQAERLRGLKKQTRGVTFREIANAAGVSERQAQRWFKGESDIDGRKLPKLAKFLGTTPNYIVNGTVEPRRRRATPDPFVRNSTGDLTAIRNYVERIEDMLAWLVLAEVGTTARAAGASEGEQPPDELGRDLSGDQPTLESQQQAQNHEAEEKRQDGTG